MKRKWVKWYLKKRMRYIEKYAKLIVDGGDQETIHRLRIGFKKLRAFLRLARLESSAEKKLKIPSKLKKIYTYAGRVRDLQIYYENILLFYDKADRYPHHVLKQIAVAKYVLFRALKHFHFHRVIQQLKKKAPDQVSERTLDKFIQQKSNAIDRLIGTNVKAIQLHTLKKQLKDVAYGLKVFHNNDQNYFPIAGKGNIEELNKLSDLLNAYMDCVVGLTLLKTARSGKLSAHDKDVMKEIKESWIDKKVEARYYANLFLC